MAIAHGGMNPRAMEAERPKKIKKEVESVNVSEADNGGHIAESRHTSFEHPPEQHVFGEVEEPQPVQKGSLFHHLAKTLHIPHSVVEAKAESADKVNAKTHEPDEEEELEEGE